MLEGSYSLGRMTDIAGAAYARAACVGLVRPICPLPFKLCELCLLRENLISTLLHGDYPTVPLRDRLILESSGSVDEE